MRQSCRKVTATTVVPFRLSECGVGLVWGAGGGLEAEEGEVIDKRVAGKGHGIDEEVGDDQWPHPAGAVEVVAVEQAHDDVAEAGGNTLVEVVSAAQD